MFGTSAASEDDLDGSFERDLVAHRDVDGLAALPRGYGCAQDLFSIGIGQMPQAPFSGLGVEETFPKSFDLAHPMAGRSIQRPRWQARPNRLG